MSFYHIITWTVLLCWLIMLFYSVNGLPKIIRLPKQPERIQDPPLVSIIVAAKEEEMSISETVKHLLSLNYPRYELIVINDRSQDETGIRMEQLKKWSSQKQNSHVPLHVIHITKLPTGWLGKNHALYQGYLQAKGSYLLFTDADILFHPETLQDAMQYVQQNHVDHLTLTPGFISNGFWLKAFVHYFMFSLWLFVRPWKANNDRQHREGVGIGAFNLIKRNAYEKIGTHQAIAMRPDDDLQLGKKVKKARLRQRLLSGTKHIEVEWYPTLTSAIHGLEKNLFSGFGYRLSFVLFAIIGELGLFLFPFIAVWISTGWELMIWILCILIIMGLFWRIIHQLTRRPQQGPLQRSDFLELFTLPFSVMLLLYVLIRSVWLTLQRGGIYWRGTFYSLKDLKKMNNS